MSKFRLNCEWGHTTCRGHVCSDEGGGGGGGGVGGSLPVLKEIQKQEGHQKQKECPRVVFLTDIQAKLRPMF